MILEKAKLSKVIMRADIRKARLLASYWVLEGRERDVQPSSDLDNVSFYDHVD